MKFQLSRNDGGVWGENLENNDEGTIVIRSTEISIDGKWDLSNPMSRSITASEFQKCRLKEGDIVVTKSSGSFKHIGKSVVVSKRIEGLNCCYSNFVQRIRFKRHLPKLYHNILNSYIVREQYRFLTQSTTGLGNLDRSSLDEVLLPLIPLNTQFQISQFLDKKTSQIDSLIEKIERKIELHIEQRTILISQCVTKGLDPKVQMKDSGVEWIGEIPSHWEIGLLKHFCSHINFKRHAKKNESKISPENVESGTGKVLDHQSDYENIGMEFEFGDTLLNKLRVYLAKFVFCEFSGLSMGEMIVLRPISIDPKFQYYLLSSCRFIDYLNSLSEGVKMPRTPIDGIMKSRVPITTIREQSQISQFLDKKTSQFNSLIEKLQRKIELLKEYRQSLISNVVTGKVKVTEDAS